MANRGGKPRVQQSKTHFLSDRDDEIDDEAMLDIDESRNSMMQKMDAWLDDAADSVGGGPAAPPDTRIWGPCHMAQYGVSGHFIEEMGTESYDGEKNPHHGPDDYDTRGPAARQNGQSVVRGGRPPAQKNMGKNPVQKSAARPPAGKASPVQNTGAPKTGPGPVRRPGGLFKNYAQQRSDQMGGPTRMDPRNLPAYGANEQQQPPANKAPVNAPVNPYAKQVEAAPAPIAQAAAPAAAQRIQAGLGYQAVSPSDPDAITVIRVDVDFGHVSLRELASPEAKNKLANVLTAKIAPGCIDDQLAGTYDPIQKKYFKVDASKAVVTKFVLTQQKNEYPIDMIVDCSGIREDGGKVQKSSSGIRAPHIMYAGTTIHTPMEIYTGSKAIGDPVLLAKYGQEDPAKLTASLAKAPVHDKYGEEYIVPNDHLLVQLIEKNKKNELFKDLVPRIAKDRIFIPTERATQLITQFAADVLGGFKLTDLNAMECTLRPANSTNKAADDLTGTKYESLSDVKKEKLVNTKFQARFSAEIHIFSSRFVKDGDVPRLFSEIPMEERGE